MVGAFCASCPRISVSAAAESRVFVLVQSGTSSNSKRLRTKVRYPHRSNEVQHRALQFWSAPFNVLGAAFFDRQQSFTRLRSLMSFWSESKILSNLGQAPVRITPLFLLCYRPNDLIDANGPRENKNCFRCTPADSRFRPTGANFNVVGNVSREINRYHRISVKRGREDIQEYCQQPGCSWPGCSARCRIQPAAAESDGDFRGPKFAEHNRPCVVEIQNRTLLTVTHADGSVETSTHLVTLSKKNLNPPRY